ncbi:hypothetical protein JXA40_00300 [bacterium]|nr:hypothetical protein [candidate division CSSED10-310 bacterium]
MKRVVSPSLMWMALIGLLITTVAYPQTSRDHEKIMVLPFKPGSEKILAAISDETAFMIQRKMDVAGFIVDRRSDSFEGSFPGQSGMDFDRIYREALSAISPESGLIPPKWLIGGEVPEIRVDSSKPVLGQKFIGYRRFPVALRIRVVLYHVPAGKLVYNTDRTCEKYIPRFSFLGLHRNPFPSTPRTIDGLIHDTLVLISRELIDALRKFEGA